MLLPESKLGVERSSIALAWRDTHSQVMKIINSFLLALKASSVDAFKLFLLHDKVLELSVTAATLVMLDPASSSFYSLSSLTASSVVSLLNLRNSLTVFWRGQFILSVKLLFLVTDLLYCDPSSVIIFPPPHQRHRRQHQRTAVKIIGAALLLSYSGLHRCLSSVQGSINLSDHWI